ncbi:hypothetical protein [Thalassotalea castellviae]|uniref:Uncharacterized protein n=1 Tax=Thalassotalea castellviae TaxID=3075612 RepID=A0ABU3A101_9GAMM|nr:hypothetical protein [Thalassotalea sp. W431]MDT0602803.1 hypothetical protein [Thalassotalea sp. W431]
MPKKVKIKGENLKAIAIVRELLDELLLAGTIISDQLSFIVDHGHLSIRCEKSNVAKETLLSIPLKCMPLLADFDFSVTDEIQIIAQPKQTVLNKQGLRFMQLMIDLYNETEKLKYWSGVFPIIALKDHPKLISVLLNAKALNKKANNFKNLYNNQQWDELLLVSFFGSREFIYKADKLSQSGINTSNKSEKGLLNVIDFLNHQTGANGYSFNADNSLIINSSAEITTGEVYVEYNYLDPLMAYLFYGFVDLSSSWIFSVMLELFTLQGNSLLVMNNPVLNKANLTQELESLNKYIPGDIQTNGVNIAVSHIVIPNNENHAALRKVIRYILLTTDKVGRYKDASYLQQEILHIEKQLIEKNYGYWKTLEGETELALLKTSNNEIVRAALTQLNNLTKINLQYIKNYVEHK